MAVSFVKTSTQQQCLPSIELASVADIIFDGRSVLRESALTASDSASPLFIAGNSLIHFFSASVDTASPLYVAP